MGSVREAWGSFHRRQQALLSLCLAGVSLCAGAQWMRWRDSRPLPPVFEDAPHARGTVAESRNDTPRIMVHVAGAVREPGVHTLPAGARVIDAVRSAGGAAPNGDINGVNLAARLTDGQQIILPMVRPQPPEVAVATQGPLQQPEPPSEQSSAVAMARPAKPSEQRPPAARSKESQLTGPINVNRADEIQLERLPGIGPALAARILEYRHQKGRFGSISDLDQVKGLGPKKLAKLQPYVAF